MTNKRTVYGKKLLTAAVLASMLSGGLAFAEEALPLYTLDAVVVTATRTENDVKNVPASTQIITSSDIKESGATNVRDALQNYANIFQSAKKRGGGHEVIIRGMDTDKSLIMVNGHRVANEADASGLGNAKAFERINVNNIEKIEIVKGPSSALYGSEAMGGVINIITKDSVEAEVRTGLVNTSEDFTNWWHFDSGSIGKFSATLDMRFNKNRTDLNKDSENWWSNDHGTEQTYNFNAKYHFNDHNYLNFYADAFSQNTVRNKKTGFKMEGMMDLDVMPPTYAMGGVNIKGGLGENHYKQRTYGLSWNAKSDRNEWQLQAYRSQMDWSDMTTYSLGRHMLMSRYDDTDYYNTVKEHYDKYIKNKYANDFNENKNTVLGIEARDTMHISENNRLTFGGEFIRNTVKGTNIANAPEKGSVTGSNGVTKKWCEKDVDTYAFYVQDEIEAGKWYIIPAVRYDHHSMYGSNMSPKLGVTYKATDTFRVKANYGKGFRAPNIPQLYYNFRRLMGSNYVTLYGNPDLKAEESTSFDIGFEKEWGKANTSLTYFHTSADNFITSVLVNRRNSEYEYRNIDKVKIDGVEHVFGYTFNNKWSFKVNSTWLDAKDKASNTDLLQRAKLSQIYSLTYDDGKDIGWTAMLWDQFDYKYEVPKESRGSLISGGKKTYNLLNFTLTRKINKDTKIYGSVQNIFDKVDSDCDLDGRYWSLGWEHKF